VSDDGYSIQARMRHLRYGQEVFLHCGDLLAYLSQHRDGLVQMGESSDALNSLNSAISTLWTVRENAEAGVKQKIIEEGE
jgi:hypothetical protein